MYGLIIGAEDLAHDPASAASPPAAAHPCVLYVVKPVPFNSNSIQRDGLCSESVPCVFRANVVVTKACALADAGHSRRFPISDVKLVARQGDCVLKLSYRSRGHFANPKEVWTSASRELLDHVADFVSEVDRATP